MPTISDMVDALKLCEDYMDGVDDGCEECPYNGRCKQLLPDVIAALERRTSAVHTRLLEAIQEADAALDSTDIHDILDALDLAKGAMLAAVNGGFVRHGRWARKEKNHVYWHECSECGERPLKSNGYYCQSTYCPFCGAKMDKEEDENG